MKNSQKLVEKYKKSLKENPTDKNSYSPNSSTKIATQKKRMLGKTKESEVAATYEVLSKHNPTNKLLAESVISTFRDFYHFGPGNKINRLKTIMIKS